MKVVGTDLGGRFKMKAVGMGVAYDQLRKEKDFEKFEAVFVGCFKQAKGNSLRELCLKIVGKLMSRFDCSEVQRV